MPLPEPTREENRAEFVSRCMSDEQANNDFPDAEQRLAVCGDIFDRSRERTMTVNDRLLAAVKSRQPKLTQFHRGILTADWYVKTVLDRVGPELCHKYMATRHASFDDVLRKAAQTLVYSDDDMEVEEIYGEKAKVPKGVELPKDTLMVFRHVLTTNTKDRDGDVLRTEGASVDPKMLLLNQHVHTMPIGKMLATVRHNKSRLELISAIVDINEICHDAAVMIDNKMGRFSHGFRAIEFEELEPGKGEDESSGFDIKEFEIMEESLVSVPANPDAETTDVLLSLVEGGKLTSQMMKEYGRTIREGRAVTVPGVEIKMKEKIGDWERELSCGSLSDLKAAHDAGLIGVKTDEDESGSGGEEAGKGNPGASKEADGDEKEKEEIAEDKEVIKGFAGNTAPANGHSHKVKLDDEGNGVTSTGNGHSHDMKAFKVMEEDGHVHGLDKDGLNETSTTSTFRDGVLIGSETHCIANDKDMESWKFQKAGRSLSKANEERLREAKSIVDEVVGMKDLHRPAKAMLKEAATALDAILTGLGGEDGEAVALTVEKAAAKFLGFSDRSQRNKMLRDLRNMEKADQKNKRSETFRSLKKSR